MKSKLLFIFLLFLVSNTYAQVKLPGIFGDHMVLQRDQAVPVWGWSSPNENIIVRVNGQSKHTRADRNGKWHITLDPITAGGPFDFIVQGKNSVILHDVLVGEVWICSGQSNMEFELSGVRNAPTEIQNAVFPEIRQIKIPHSISVSPKNDILPATWEKCSPEHPVTSRPSDIFSPGNWRSVYMCPLD